jgi:hypothetical protein
MKAVVVELRRTPDPEVLETCRDLLARAERGELRSVAIAAITEDGEAIAHAAADDYRAQLVGALELCKLRLFGLISE